MAFDLFQSRRNYNELCKWWSRNENDDYEEDEYIFKRVPDGYFFAKETSAESNDQHVISGIIMVDRTSVNISSPDDLSDIKSKDIVEYQGEIWRVETIQKRKVRIQGSEFANDNNMSHYWYLSLIKG